jgi:hypothetical protein
MQKKYVIHYYIDKQILDSYLHTKSEQTWLLFTFVLNWVFLLFPWQRQAFWNFQASKPFIHMPYNISIKIHPIPSTLNFSRFLWQRRPFWNFYASKLCVHMSDKISGKFHPIPSTITNQRWISTRNIIIYLETKFRWNRRIFVFGGHFIPWLPWQWPPFWIFSTPKSCHILRWIFLQSGS